MNREVIDYSVLIVAIQIIVLNTYILDAIQEGEQGLAQNGAETH